MRFDVRFNQTDQKLAVVFNSGNKGFNTVFQNIQFVTKKPDVEYYNGEYFVTPKVDEQIVPTSHKFMTDDLTVKAIPTYNVGNTSGGSTFYIATLDTMAILGKTKLGETVL